MQSTLLFFLHVSLNINWPFLCARSLFLRSVSGGYGCLLLPLLLLLLNIMFTTHFIVCDNIVESQPKIPCFSLCSAPLASFLIAMLRNVVILLYFIVYREHKKEME
jgi:hypothetical protein